MVRLSKGHHNKGKKRCTPYITRGTRIRDPRGQGPKSWHPEGLPIVVGSLSVKQEPYGLLLCPALPTSIFVVFFAFVIIC